MTKLKTVGGVCRLSRWFGEILKAVGHVLDPIAEFKITGKPPFPLPHADNSAAQNH